MHWLATLPFAISIAIILAIAWFHRERQPLGWLAWASDVSVRTFALVGTLLLGGAGWTAWTGGFAAIVEIDWINGLLLWASTVVAITPLILLLDIADHLKRRRAARGES